MNSEKIVVVGLGYVGLPVALAFADAFAGTLGFDISAQRVHGLQSGRDTTGEVDAQTLRASPLRCTLDEADLVGASLYVVTVPTPIDAARQPDLGPLRRACETVGRALRAGSDAIVCFESTVYPGVTEDVCGPLLEQVSGLRRGTDFRLAYSPERINPGDRQRTLGKIVKVVSGEDEATLTRVASAYGAIIEAGIHRAPSIKVAEAAKVIENTQRDLNIALMNELALIFERIGIRTSDVLAAAGTKWNFLRFTPGLVGGHCIGVDPYYLTHKAEALGLHPQVILAGRHINDGMGAYCAQRLVKTMIAQGMPIKGARVGVLGLTFKENVPDLRNSRVPDIVNELRSFGIEPLIHDPLADSVEAQHEYGLTLSSLDTFSGLHGLVLAVPHADYLRCPVAEWEARLLEGGVFADLKSACDRLALSPSRPYWSL
ncbi:nucleotide sugar dehydrogenase [Solimonas terrae]|uniref:Nucleotide sugar dehydrogenase n=1 Tax=Solimonas terrae TaxID=1396819 RepID=A0A6M2BTG4_9GAMM|nr:nucleotide sugar dehydrogenase [Solimonas terrae]NGY05403.1 nucleotide sugar dehydrogenase [Solimonas terrae]